MNRVIDALTYPTHARQEEVTETSPKDLMTAIKVVDPNKNFEQVDYIVKKVCLCVRACVDDPVGDVCACVRVCVCGARFSVKSQNRSQMQNSRGESKESSPTDLPVIFLLQHIKSMIIR